MIENPLTEYPLRPIGQRVRIADHVGERGLNGHHRAPAYARGKAGVIERLCGNFHNPEQLAYGKRDGALVPLYRVRIPMGALWSGYRGAKQDTLEIEVYEHWLEEI